MRIAHDYTHNSSEIIEVGAVLVLNKAERQQFAKRVEGWCGGETVYVSLPFSGMVESDRATFMQTGQVELHYWTEKDGSYLDDESELRMLESMLADDMNGVRRLAKVRDRRQPSKPSWLRADFWDRVLLAS